MRGKAIPRVSKLASIVGRTQAFFSLTPSYRSDRLNKRCCRTHGVPHARALPSEILRCAVLIALLAEIFIAISLGIFGAAQAQTSGNAIPSLKIVQRLSRPPNVTGLAWSPDGSKLATFSNYTSVVTIWDASDWHIIREFRRVIAGYANAFAWMPNGLLLTPMGAKTSDEARLFSLSLWDPRTGTLVKNIPGPTDKQSQKRNAAGALAVSQDGSEVAMANNVNLHHVFLFEPQSWSIEAALKVNEIPEAIAFGAPRRLAVGGTDGQVAVFDLARRAVERTISAFPSDRSVTSTAFSPNGEFLAAVPTDGYGGVTATPLDGGPVRIWKVASGERVAMLGANPGNWTLPQVAWSADGTILAAISNSGLLEAWRMGSAPASVFEQRFPTYGSAVSFSPNGTLAAAIGAEVVILK